MERRDLPIVITEPDIACRNREIRAREYAAALPCGREAGI